jgi:cytochrome c556
MKLKAAIVGAVLIVGLGAAVAQGDVVAQRQAILKSFGAGVGDPGKMLRGEAPFDLAKVKAVLATVKADAPKLGALFPDTSLGGTSKALPLIATERDKFAAIFTKLAADANAVDAAITNEATFKTEFPKVLANCGACHRVYRQPQ